MSHLRCQRNAADRLTAVAAIALAVALSGDAAMQPPAIVVSNVNLIDVESGAVRGNMTVVVGNGRIADVVASGARTPPGARVVDGRGKFLIPGLWDMHIHWYDERFLPLFIANGVTGVRQMFGGPLHLTWRRRIESGELLGPRHVVGSTIVDGAPPVWPGSLVVTTPEQARETVQRIKTDGFDFVKVYSRLPREAYFAILEEAKRQGLTAQGHVPNGVTVWEATDAGQRTIEHLTGVLLAASKEEDELRARGARLPQPTIATPSDADARNALRDYRQRIFETYDDSKAASLFARFRKNGTWHVPTLTVIRSGASTDDPAFTNDPRLRFMPPAVSTSWKPENNPRIRMKTKDEYELDRRILQLQYKAVGAMHRGGVNILAGTDVLNPFVFPGFSLHDELALLVQAGLSPLDALRAATLNPAKYLGTTATQGTVDKGKVGDLVLLDANPLDDITATTRINAVIVNGRLFERKALDEMLSAAEKTAKGSLSPQ